MNQEVSKVQKENKQNKHSRQNKTQLRNNNKTKGPRSIKKQLQQGFSLHCINVIESKLPHYVSIRDQHLQNFFYKNRQARKIMRSITKAEQDKNKKVMITRLPYIKQKQSEHKKVNKETFKHFLEMKQKQIKQKENNDQYHEQEIRSKRNSQNYQKDSQNFSNEGETDQKQLSKQKIKHNDV